MMREWGTMEDYTGMAYIREHIPAENDVYKKMKPVWGKKYYPDGKLLYEGFMADGMAYGAGTSYHPCGKRCQEGLFGPNGLICGREYYNNGRIRFEGTYQYNPRYGENWPIFGAFYDGKGNLKYYGAFDIIGEHRNAVQPYVLEPEDYGPVSNPLVTRFPEFRFKGNKARKHYVECSPEYEKKIREDAHEYLRKICNKKKILAYLHLLLKDPCPEARKLAKEELVRRGEWSEEDRAKLAEAEEMYSLKESRMTPGERYKRDLDLLDVPASELQEQIRMFDGKPDEELDRYLDWFAKLMESMYPYRWGKDPRHGIFRESFAKKGINQENWLDHLNEMTDREISYMLDQEPGIGKMNEMRHVYPEMDEREYAEFKRYF